MPDSFATERSGWTAFAPLRLLRAGLDTVIGYGWWVRTEVASQLSAARRYEHPRPRHVLLLASSLPPAVNGGVFRPMSFLKYGAELGWTMTAIAGGLRHVHEKAGAELLATLPQDVIIHRIRPKIQPSWRLFPQIEGGAVNALAMVSLARRLFDGYLPTIVLASGPSFYSFVAGCYLARFFDAKLVLDYRDEWTECPFDFVSTGVVDRLMERRILSRADAVIFTTNSHRQHQLAVFPQLSEGKCHVIPNGWEPNAIYGGQAETPRTAKRSGEIMISYVGNLGPYTRPGKFLTSLARLLERGDDLRQQVKLRFVGNVLPAERSVLNAFPFQDRIEILDHVPRPEAVRYMRESDLLLILAEPELARYRPGKLYDYLAAGPPVLVCGHRGEASDLVERLGAGVFVPEGDEGALWQLLDDLCKGMDILPARSPEIDAWLQRHTREHLAGELFEILEQLIEGADAVS